VPAVFFRQFVAGLGCGQQLDLGAIRELDVLVADAVVVRPARLEGEPQIPVALSRFFEIGDGDDDVVQAKDGRTGLVAASIRLEPRRGDDEQQARNHLDVGHQSTVSPLVYRALPDELDPRDHRRWTRTA
jgi:hypothetical protein